MTLKINLFFINTLACLLLVFAVPVAIQKNTAHTAQKIEELKSEGVIDAEKLGEFATKIKNKEISKNILALIDWMHDSTATNYYIAFPAFMILLLNSMLLLKIWIRDNKMQKSE